eukprot:5758258-Pleurochrysis_carterae.AAC.1
MIARAAAGYEGVLDSECCLYTNIFAGVSNARPSGSNRVGCTLCRLVYHSVFTEVRLGRGHSGSFSLANEINKRARTSPVDFTFESRAEGASCDEEVFGGGTGGSGVGGGMGCSVGGGG